MCACSLRFLDIENHRFAPCTFAISSSLGQVPLTAVASGHGPLGHRGGYVRKSEKEPETSARVLFGFASAIPRRGVMPSDLKPVAGSQRTPLRDAKAVGKVDLKHHIEVTVRVRSRSADAEWDARIMETNSKHPSERTYLSREDLAAHRGADPEDLAKIDAFAHAHHLTVIETSIPKRAIRLAGTADDLSQHADSPIMPTPAT